MGPYGTVWEFGQPSVPIREVSLFQIDLYTSIHNWDNRRCLIREVSWIQIGIWGPNVEVGVTSCGDKVLWAIGHWTMYIYKHTADWTVLISAWLPICTWYNKVCRTLAWSHTCNRGKNGLSRQTCHAKFAPPPTIIRPPAEPKLYQKWFRLC